MSIIKNTERIWWKQPLDREEKVWVSVALIWCILITLIMPVMHFMGKQNAPWETYKIKKEKFAEFTDKFIEKYKIGEEGSIAIVQPPPDSDVFLVGRDWKWEPILKLEKGKTYRIHLSSADFEHGLSIYPINMNFMAIPEYDYVLTMTPTESGTYYIICNEFCGIGHHQMLGKMIIT